MAKRNARGFAPPRGAGFTLIEILIVATITAILAAGLGSSFLSGMKLWGRAKGQDMTRFNAWLALDVMAKELRQSVKVPFAKFKGDAHQLTFPAVLGNTIVKITYTYDGYEKRLRREEVGFQDLVEGTLEPQTKTRVLLALAQELTIEFATFDPTLQETGKPKGYQWTDAWDEDTGVPAAIRLTVKMRNATLTKTILLPIA